MLCIGQKQIKQLAITSERGLSLLFNNNTSSSTFTSSLLELEGDVAVVIASVRQQGDDEQDATRVCFGLLLKFSFDIISWMLLFIVSSSSSFSSKAIVIVVAMNTK